jgi:predicted nucleic acid-binding protein
VLESWQVIELTADIAESAARLWATLKIKLPDAIQAASAIVINADALVMHDRDFSRVTGHRVIGQPLSCSESVLTETAAAADMPDE